MRPAAGWLSFQFLLGLLPPLVAVGGCHSAATGPLAQRQQAPIASAGPSAVVAGEKLVRLYLTSRLQNELEPCGCSSVSLGDVARLSALLKSTPGALLLDTGGLRYKDEPISEDRRVQARLKADFLESLYASFGAIVMVQPADLRGPQGTTELASTKRLVSNLDGLPAGSFVTEEIRTHQGLAIGLLGLVDAEASWPQGLVPREPLAAATQGVRRLRERGAQVVIALTGLRRDQARRLLRKVPGLDVAVVGNDRELVTGLEQAEQVGQALLLCPSQKGERALRLDLHLSPTGQPVWTLVNTDQQQQQQVAAGRQRLAARKEQLAALQADRAADPAFVQTTADEVTRLQAELQRLTAPLTRPESGYVQVEQVPLTRSLPRDPVVAQRMEELDRQIGELNLKASAGPPPPAAATQPSYIGVSGCQRGCHDEAVEFWRTTRHAHAWQTLVDVKKDLSLDCVQCHSVGFDEAGGANLWTLTQWQRGLQAAATAGKNGASPDLRNIQCEVCHGPGSLHVRSPMKVPIPVPRPVEGRCRSCHTVDHSDTFAFAPYLRDILGPGHGEAKRLELGPGPTGHELRSAALQKHSPGHK